MQTKLLRSINNNKNEEEVSFGEGQQVIKN